MEFTNLPFTFPAIEISGDSIANLAFFLVALFAAVASAILFFHWHKYGLGGKILKTMEVLYFGVAVILLCGAFLGLN